MATTQQNQYPPPRQGQVITIYHSCDPPNQQVLHHFRASRHKVGHPAYDVYATEPVYVQLPSKGGKFRTGVRCAEESCDKCEYTETFSDLTLSAAKSHGIIRVPLAPSSKAQTAQERLADGEVRGEWIYRDLAWFEFTIEPLRNVDVRPMGKLGKVGHVLKWLEKVSDPDADPEIEELQAKGPPDTVSQVDGYGDDEWVAVGGDWQGLKKHRDAANDQSMPPLHTSRLTQDNLSRQQKCLKSSVVARPSPRKPAPRRDSLLRSAQRAQAAQYPAPPPPAADAYTYAYPMPGPAPVMAGGPTYAYGFTPGYNENASAIQQYAEPLPLPLRLAMPPAMPPHLQPYGAVPYDSFAGYVLPQYPVTQA